MSPPDQPGAEPPNPFAQMLQTLKEERGPEGFERELRLARRRQERAARPKPKKVGPQESLNLLPELKRRFAEQERKVEGILARRRAAEQARQALCDIARAAVGAG